MGDAAKRISGYTDFRDKHGCSYSETVAEALAMCIATTILLNR